MDTVIAPRFDLDDPAFILDPYPYYAWLRETAPVHPATTPGMWIVSRYDDVNAVLRDPHLFSSRRDRTEVAANDLGSGASRLLSALIRRRMPRTVVTVDPPEHAALRKKVGRVFTPRRIEEWENRIRVNAEDLVDRMIAAAADGTPVDLVAALARPLPTMVFTELMNIPPRRRADFRRWSDRLIGGLRENGSARVVTGGLAVGAYTTGLVRRRRQHPGEDPISILLTAGDSDAPTTTDLVIFCILLLVDGNTPTTDLMTNTVLALLDNDLWYRLAEDPKQAGAAIEETLRYDNPAQALLRTVTTETTLHGVPLPAGSRVLALLGSANRDPRHWEAPPRIPPRPQHQGPRRLRHRHPLLRRQHPGPPGIPNRPAGPGRTRPPPDPRGRATAHRQPLDPRPAGPTHTAGPHRVKRPRPGDRAGSMSPGELAGLPAYFAGAVKGWLIVVKYWIAARMATGAVTKI
ncbi:cytochrome P450 [Nocardia crassostreae]|uniref:cytochrome P450 n=1 Tax=Nocardia crassostreae TaxID=53428 RepID=UPI000832E57F|nr:cytochrome P450 [Nocardia crassostreae]